MCVHTDRLYTKSKRPPKTSKRPSGVKWKRGRLARRRSRPTSRETPAASICALGSIPQKRSGASASMIERPTRPTPKPTSRTRDVSTRPWRRRTLSTCGPILVKPGPPRNSDVLATNCAAVSGSVSSASAYSASVMVRTVSFASRASSGKVPCQGNAATFATRQPTAAHLIANCCYIERQPEPSLPQWLPKKARIQPAPVAAQKATRAHTGVCSVTL